MGVSPTRLVKLILLSLIVTTGLFAAFVIVRGYREHREELSKEEARARRWGQEGDDGVAKALPDTRTLRVWAAGFRSSTGEFCSPCSMFPPPTLLYETSDAREIQEFGKLLLFRRTPTGPEIGNCGPLTFDFVRGEEILHSFNFKPSRLSDESAKHIAAWLLKRDIWSKRDAAIAAGAKKK